MGTVSRTLRTLPAPFRDLGFSIIPFKWRYGKTYREFQDFLAESERWPLGRMQLWQEGRLRLLLLHAYAHVPYYRRIFNERKVSPAHIGSASLRTLPNLLPILTKDAVKAHGAELVARPFDREIVNISTSGSTGEPLRFAITKDLFQIEAAFTARAYRAHHTKLYQETTVWLRHYAPESWDPVYRVDKELRRIYLSPYHLSPYTLKEYVEIIDGAKATTLSAYPSSAYILACLLEDSGIRLRHIDRVHTASEKLLDAWRDKIETVIGPVYDHYGAQEKVSLFHQCPESYGLYHENMEYGVTEIVDGRVIGTGLWNYAMPLIRYEIGDLATEILNPSNQCPCGSHLPLRVSSFDGRSDDILEGSHGRRIPPVNFYTMMYKVPGVEMFCIKQFLNNDVVVEIVPGQDFSPTTVDMLRSELSNRLGFSPIAINLVQEIPRERGKVKCIKKLSA